MYFKRANEIGFDDMSAVMDMQNNTLRSSKVDGLHNTYYYDTYAGTDNDVIQKVNKKTGDWVSKFYIEGALVEVLKLNTMLKFEYNEQSLFSKITIMDTTTDTVNNDCKELNITYGWVDGRVSKVLINNQLVLDIPTECFV